MKYYFEFYERLQKIFEMQKKFSLMTLTKSFPSSKYWNVQQEVIDLQKEVEIVSEVQCSSSDIYSIIFITLFIFDVLKEVQKSKNDYERKRNILKRTKRKIVGLVLMFVVISWHKQDVFADRIYLMLFVSSGIIKIYNSTK